MREEDILVEPPDDESPFSSFLRRRRSAGPRAAVLILVLLVVAAGAAWWFFLRDGGAGIEPVPSAAGEVPPALPDLAADEPIELPAVDTSDSFVRRLIARLSTHPQFAEWLVTDELARRFVATIADFAHGSSPAPHLRFMAPTDPFRVREYAGDQVVDETSYRRYDAMATTFASLDAQATARLVRQLTPLFEEAHRELGFPDRTFQSDLARAVSNVLAVEVSERPPVVVRGENGWIYADPELEARSTAAKHLMRMGPENAQRVQAKVLEIATALGLPVPE